MNTTIGIRIVSEDRRLLDDVCKVRGEDLSSFVRRAIKKELVSLGFYDIKTRKALGLVVCEKD